MLNLDFSKDFDFNSKDSFRVKIKDNNKEVIFISYLKYEGPITLQYLDNGGIISLFNYHLIIKVNNGYLDVTKLKYEDKVYTSKEFINLFGSNNLLNHYFVSIK